MFLSSVIGTSSWVNRLCSLLPRKSYTTWDYRRELWHQLILNHLCWLELPGLLWQGIENIPQVSKYIFSYLIGRQLRSTTKHVCIKTNQRQRQVLSFCTEIFIEILHESNIIIRFLWNSNFILIPSPDCVRAFQRLTRMRPPLPMSLAKIPIYFFS